MVNFILFIGWFIISFKEEIFLTFILLNLFSLSIVFLDKVISKELPSFNLDLLDSKTSEKIKSSKAELKSENLTIAYVLPFCVFFS